MTQRVERLVIERRLMMKTRRRALQVDAVRRVRRPRPAYQEPGVQEEVQPPSARLQERLQRSRVRASPPGGRLLSVLISELMR